MQKTGRPRSTRANTLEEDALYTVDQNPSSGAVKDSFPKTIPTNVLFNTKRDDTVFTFKESTRCRREAIRDRSSIRRGFLCQNDFFIFLQELLLGLLIIKEFHSKMRVNPQGNLNYQRRYFEELHAVSYQNPHSKISKGRILEITKTAHSLNTNIIRKRLNIIADMGTVLKKLGCEKFLDRGGVGGEYRFRRRVSARLHAKEVASMKGMKGDNKQADASIISILFFLHFPFGFRSQPTQTRQTIFHYFCLTFRGSFAIWIDIFYPLF
ncbi:hypothetical protein CEXT_77751 [Caerostris extrusa]|uniref:Uncharacterized protein n=1 Tax=Caerostris extrusa TaxID=172846 RepID=A0AAV4U5L8_CAEEX|nr:hypothetical protein CEXT_77751 [Caerostris extrusa]